MGGAEVAGDYAAFQATDMQDLEWVVATADYAAVDCTNLVQAAFPDPSTADQATVAQYEQQYGPTCDADAQAWQASASLSDIVSLQDMPRENWKCLDPPYNCKRQEWCPIGDGAACFVTQCADLKCPWCPAFGNLIYKGYCAYACYRANYYWGYGVRLITHWGLGEFLCFPFPKKK